MRDQTSWNDIAKPSRLPFEEQVTENGTIWTCPINGNKFQMTNSDFRTFILLKNPYPSDTTDEETLSENVRWYTSPSKLDILTILWLETTQTRFIHKIRIDTKN